jgi:hypothetical protein
MLKYQIKSSNKRKGLNTQLIIGLIDLFDELSFEFAFPAL